MARIAGVDLPNKAVKIALTYIYGIGNKSAMDAVGLNMMMDVVKQMNSK